MIKKGVVSRGDGTHVDHKKSLDSGGSGRSLSNLKVISAKSNMKKEVARKRSKKGNN